MIRGVVYSKSLLAASLCGVVAAVSAWGWAYSANRASELAMQNAQRIKRSLTAERQELTSFSDETLQAHKSRADAFRQRFVTEEQWSALRQKAIGAGNDWVAGAASIDGGKRDGDGAAYGRFRRDYRLNSTGIVDWQKILKFVQEVEAMPDHFGIRAIEIHTFGDGGHRAFEAVRVELVYFAEVADNKKG